MDDKPVYHTELGEANDHVAWTFCRLRYMSCLLKDQIKADCLWQDFEQELKTIACDAWIQDLTMQETWRYASNRIRAFLVAYGYKRYRNTFIRQETVFSAIFEDWQEVNLPEGKSQLHSLFREDTGLREAALRKINNHPEGVTVSRLIPALDAPANEIHAVLDSLVKKGHIVQVRAEATEGNRPTFYFPAGARIPEMKPVHTEMYEQIRQLYLEGKSTRWISREYHHNFTTIKKALQGLDIRRGRPPKALHMGISEQEGELTPT